MTQFKILFPRQILRFAFTQISSTFLCTCYLRTSLWTQTHWIVFNKHPSQWQRPSLHNKDIIKWTFTKLYRYVVTTASSYSYIWFQFFLYYFHWLRWVRIMSCGTYNVMSKVGSCLEKKICSNFEFWKYLVEQKRIRALQKEVLSLPWILSHSLTLLNYLLQTL